MQRPKPTYEQGRVGELRKLGLDKCAACPNSGRVSSGTSPLDAFVFCSVGGKEGGEAANIFVTRARGCTIPTVARE